MSLKLVKTVPIRILGLMDQFSDTAHGVDEYFAKLEQASFDPILKKAADDAKEYNKLIADLGLDADDESDTEELRAILAALDKAWEPIFEERVKVSGIVEHDSEDEGFVTKTVDQSEMVCKGFVFDVHGPAPELVYLFLELTKEGDQYTAIPWYAHLDNVFIDIDTMMSSERAEAVLELNCPDLKEQIDDSLFGFSPDERLLDAELMALKRLGRIIYEMPEGANALQIAAATSVYSEDAIGFDETLPYSMSMSGILYFADQTDVKLDTTISNVLVTEPRLYFIDDPKSQTYEFILACTLHSAHQRSDDGKAVLITLESLTDFTPIRDLMTSD